MSFDLRQTIQSNQPQGGKNDKQEEQQTDFKSKHTYKIQQQSKTVIVSFRFTPETKPDLNEGKIVYILKKIVQENPLAGAPRSYGHKFYLSFEERPRDGVLMDIQRAVQQAYKGTKVFVKRDEVTQKELSTLYIGKMLGVDKQLMQEFLEYLEIKYKEVRVAMDKDTGRPKNFGYVEFATPEEAEAALPKLQGQKVGLSDGLKVRPMVDE